MPSISVSTHIVCEVFTSSPLADPVVVTDLYIYPAAVLYLMLAIGIYLIRYRRRDLNLPRPAFRAWDFVLIFNIIAQLYLIIMPWYPPDTGADGGDVSFWNGTHIVTGLGILLFCALYYLLWIYLIPRLRGYRIRQELIDLGNGAQSHRLAKVPISQLDEWDATHDAVGGQTARTATNKRSSNEKRSMPK